MGCINLMKEVKNKHGNVGLNCDLSRIRYSKIAIDTSIFLYKVLKSEMTLIQYFSRLCGLLLRQKVAPVFVFDGKPAAEKMNEIRRRRLRKRDTDPTVVPDDYNNCRRFLNAMNIPHITVNDHDAEAFCCYLNRIGYVDHVMSEDSDVILYRGRSWIKGFDIISGKFILYDVELLRKLCVQDHGGRPFEEIYLDKGCDFDTFRRIPDDSFEIFRQHVQILGAPRDFVGKILENADVWAVIDAGYLPEFSLELYESFYC